MAHAERRITIWTLIALAIGVLFFWASAPPAPVRLDVTAWDDLAARTVAGAFHIHTTRSDGHGDRARIAAAAARAGLKFVILTDHGDGTRPPDPPVYIDGVLVLDAVEISTEEGHYVALDMTRAPYPLGGFGEAVVEDVRRLGGFGVIAHPDSPKPTLRWTSHARPDGVEWMNLDSEWRDETRAQLLRAGAGYLLHRGAALTAILDRPTTLDARWPALLAEGTSVGLAAADAHGGAGRRDEDPGRSLAGTIGIPSYESSFGAFSNSVILPKPLTGDAASDARAVYASIRGGRVFSTVDGLAGPGLLHFSAEAGLRQSDMGAVLPGDFDGALVVRTPAPAGSEIFILRNGRVVVSTRGPELRHTLTGATGAYRAEVRLPGSPGVPPVPWIVSNPIYFGVGAGKAPVADPVESGPLEGTIAPFPWSIEKDPSSSAMLRTGATEASLEFKLGEGERRSQFVALATDLQPGPLSAIQLSLAGDRPMRVWVQLRAQDGTRWGKSYYVDPAGTAILAPVSSLGPLGPPAGNATIGDARSLLIVVDLANAQPGRTGVLRVRASALLR